MYLTKLEDVLGSQADRVDVAGARELLLGIVLAGAARQLLLDLLDGGGRVDLQLAVLKDVGELLLGQARRHHLLEDRVVELATQALEVLLALHETNPLLVEVPHLPQHLVVEFRLCVVGAIEWARAHTSVE